MSPGSTVRSTPRKRLSAPERREVIEQAALEVFTERGYHGASIDEICRRAGVTPPVLYDHFPSKLALHKRLLERTRDELLEMWRQQLGGDDPVDVRIPRALDAWARYVEEHPYAPRMFFTETTGDPEARAIHDQVQAQSVAALGAILGQQPGAELIAGSAEAEALQMASEVFRGGLTTLAIWWAEHPHITREQIVTTAMNTVWIGLERISRGEAWRPAAEAC